MSHSMVSSRSPPWRPLSELAARRRVVLRQWDQADPPVRGMPQRGAWPRRLRRTGNVSFMVMRHTAAERQPRKALSAARRVRHAVGPPELAVRRRVEDRSIRCRRAHALWAAIRQPA